MTGNVVQGPQRSGPPRPLRRVMIATPVHDGRCDVEYAHAMGETIRLCTMIGIDARPLYWPGEALVQVARIRLLEHALRFRFDDMIFIDADQEWKPEWVPQLLKYPVDCVGGAVIKKDERAESYNVHAKSIHVPVCPNTGLLMPDGLGTGFLRLSMNAMRALWLNSEEFLDDFGNHLRWAFDVRPVNGRLVGEDIGMAMKLKAAGIQVYLDPTITCAHIGRKKFTGDFGAWLKRLQDKEFVVGSARDIA